jgi:sarcosine oxidase subunit beta
MFSQRGVMNLAHNLQDVRDLKRRTHANRLNGIDAVWLETDEVKKFCPIINTSQDIRYPVLGGTLQKELVRLDMMLLHGVMQEALMKWELI